MSGMERWTERSRKVGDLALREALSLGHNYVGTEHLLLGLVREEEGLAYRVLVALGATPDVVRNEVIRQLSGTKPKKPKTIEERMDEMEVLLQELRAAHNTGKEPE